MSDETCPDCGREITDDHRAFSDQWEPEHRELCLQMQNFGGYQLCAERKAERLEKLLAESERKLAEASQRLEQAERAIAAADGLRWNGCLTAFGGVNPYLEAYDTERAKFTSAGDSSPAKPPQPPQR